MKNTITFNKLFNSVRSTVSYKVQTAIVEFTEQVVDRISALQITRSEFSERLNTSPAYVTKLLSGGTNFTLESMVKVGNALDSDVQIHLTPRDSAIEWIRVIGGSVTHRPRDYRLMNEWRRLSQADETSVLLGACGSNPDADFDEVFLNS